MSQKGLITLRNSSLNKGNAFTLEERAFLGLDGLLPPAVDTLEAQIKRTYSQFKQAATPLDKYTFCSTLKERNQTLFYAFTLRYMAEVLPVIYTPTVGDACVQLSHIWRFAQGMYFTPNDKGKIRKMLDNWTEPDVQIIVVTDGSRILGLGDLGANGMGIPIGKLSLYVAGSGFHPSKTLPIQLDTGTNNKHFLSDELYLGLRHPRVKDEMYYPFIEEFLMAIKDKWPKALVQFEDFSNDHCFELLDRYRSRLRCFNDDIQGTGAVIASGFTNAVKVTGIPMEKQKIVFFGAGSAAVGVATSLAHAMVLHGKGLNTESAMKHFYLVDSQGLVTNSRGGKALEKHKIPWARSDIPAEQNPNLRTLIDVINYVKPTALIGLSGQANAFTPDTVKLMGSINHRPIIFALSNPTRNCELTAEVAYNTTSGRVIFASGSPFPPVTVDGKTYYPGQGNNMFIFPGLGFGAWLCQATKVSDEMIAAATAALSDCTTQADFDHGRIYPNINRIREISVLIAARVMQTAYEQHLATLQPKPTDLVDYVKKHMWEPSYTSKSKL